MVRSPNRVHYDDIRCGIEWKEVCLLTYYCSIMSLIESVAEQLSVMGMQSYVIEATAISLS